MNEFQIDPCCCLQKTFWILLLAFLKIRHPNQVELNMFIPFGMLITKKIFFISGEDLDSDSKAKTFYFLIAFLCCKNNILNSAVEPHGTLVLSVMTFCEVFFFYLACIVVFKRSSAQGKALQRILLAL